MNNPTKDQIITKDNFKIVSEGKPENFFKFKAGKNLGKLAVFVRH